MVAYTRQHIQRAALDLHLTDSECLRNVLGQSLDLRIPHGFGLRTQLPNSHMGIGSCCSHLQLHQMLILHFAYCRPYYSRWDFSVQGECWPEAVSEVTAYVQIASNIFTDLVGNLHTLFAGRY